MCVCVSVCVCVCVCLCVIVISNIHSDTFVTARELLSAVTSDVKLLWFFLWWLILLASVQM